MAFLFIGHGSIPLLSEPTLLPTASSQNASIESGHHAMAHHYLRLSSLRDFTWYVCHRHHSLLRAASVHFLSLPAWGEVHSLWTRWFYWERHYQAETATDRMRSIRLTEALMDPTIHMLLFNFCWTAEVPLRLLVRWWNADQDSADDYHSGTPVLKNGQVLCKK